MARPLVPDDLWAVAAALLPPARPKPRGGRPPIPDRAALTGIVFVLKAGIPWEDLPAEEMGCGSGMGCRRRLRDWRAAGVWLLRCHMPVALPAGEAPARRGGLAGWQMRRSARRCRWPSSSG